MVISRNHSWYHSIAQQPAHSEALTLLLSQSSRLPKVKLVNDMLRNAMLLHCVQSGKCFAEPSSPDLMNNMHAVTVAIDCNSSACSHVF